MQSSQQSSNTHHSKILKRPSRLNVLQRRLQITNLRINPPLGLFCALHSLRLESLNGLDLPSHIVLLNLEAIDLLLDVVDDGAVLEDGAVVGEVDLLGLLGEELDPTARVVVALFECDEGVGGAAAET